MLIGISKLLTGDLLKVLCDMGHGDVLVIADANFPAETMGKRVIRYPGIDAVALLKEIASVFPLDHVVENPCCVMEVEIKDKERGLGVPKIFEEFESVLKESYGEKGIVSHISRQEFYRQSQEAYVVIQTGEERLYGNLMLVKGTV